MVRDPPAPLTATSGFPSGRSAGKVAEALRQETWAAS